MSDLSITTKTPPLSGDGPAVAVSGSWQEQDVVLREMWMDNKSPQVIAEKLSRSVSAIMTRAARLGLPRRTAPGRKPRPQMPDDMSGGSQQPNTGTRDTRRLPIKATAKDIDLADKAVAASAPRICLMCLRTFQSVGRHNRICASCKGSSEYASASTLADIHLPST